MTTAQEERLEYILRCAGSARLTTFEREFTQSIAERYAEQGAEMFVSNKMWAILSRIEDKVHD